MTFARVTGRVKLQMSNDDTQQNRTALALASSAFCTNSLTIEMPSAERMRRRD
jgi:hypothetical protein